MRALCRDIYPPLWWEDCCVLTWCWSACHMTHCCWGLQQWDSLIYRLYFWIFFPHWNIPPFWTFKLFWTFNSQIFPTQNKWKWEIAVKDRPCYLPHLNPTQKDTCRNSADWSERQGWDLSHWKISDPQSTKRNTGTPKRSRASWEYKYMWRLLLCGGHIWLDFNWRAASQSLFALTSAQMAYAFLKHHIHTL